MPISAMEPAAWATASGKSPTASATLSASWADSAGTRSRKIATDSIRANTSTSTGTATSAHLCAREVISTCPVPPGSHGISSSGSSALSNTSSHRSRPRNSASTARPAATRSAPSGAQLNSPASAATCSPISPACSAAIHHTRSYPAANRCAYSAASCVLPTPPMPCRACTTVRSPASSFSRTEISRPSRPVNPGFLVGTFQIRGNIPGRRGPAPPNRLSPPGRPPGNPGSRSGRPSAVTAFSSDRRATSCSTPNTSQYTSGRSAGGT